MDPINDMFRKQAEENMKEQFKKLPWEQKLGEYMIEAICCVLGITIGVVIVCLILNLVL